MDALRETVIFMILILVGCADSPDGCTFDRGEHADSEAYQGFDITLTSDVEHIAKAGSTIVTLKQAEKYERADSQMRELSGRISEWEKKGYIDTLLSKDVLMSYMLEYKGEIELYRFLFREWKAKDVGVEHIRTAAGKVYNLIRRIEAIYSIHTARKSTEKNQNPLLRVSIQSGPTRVGPFSLCREI